MRSPVILRIFKNSQLVEVKQFDKDQIIFGHGGDVDVELADSAVSPIHCLIELRDSGYYLADLGSSTGTSKKNVQVLDEALSSGDQINVGPFVIHFFVGVPKPKAPPEVAVKPINVSIAPQKPIVVTAVAPVVSPSVAVDTTAKELEKLRPHLPEAEKLPKKSSTGKTGKSSRKTRTTFAPPSQITDLKTYLRPTKGPVLEVLVAWKERIISSHHFSTKKQITMGPEASCDINIPSTFLAQKILFANLAQGTKIFLANGMTPEIYQTEKKYDAELMHSLGKSTREKNGVAVRLDQGELLSITVGDGTLQIFVRHVPGTMVPSLSGLDLTAGELTGLIVSFVVVALLALYVSVYNPGDQGQDKQEDQLKLAKFVYTAKEIPTPKPPEPPPKPVEQPPPKLPLQKVEVVKNSKDTSGDPKKKSAAMRDKPARAEEVRTNNSKSTRKTFTSAIKQGGAVKTTDKAAANAASKKDVNDMGLLSAFSGGGTRKSLDKAYSGSGELIGTGSQATGSSGMNENRPGDDLGGKFKDTGAGGKGTATQGIAGIKTLGRSSGQDKYGNVGVGGKGSVAIEAGGTGAEFVGTVDREQVRRVVRSILAQIKSCFDRGLVTNSNLEGKIVIHWEVVEQGHVKLSNVKDSPKELKEVATCVAAKIREQRFPEPPGGSYYEVDYPFMMSKQN